MQYCEPCVKPWGSAAPVVVVVGGGGHHWLKVEAVIRSTGRGPYLVCRKTHVVCFHQMVRFGSVKFETVNPDFT